MIVLLIGMICIACCGCLQKEGQEGQLQYSKDSQVPGYTRAVYAIKTFMNNASYDMRPINVTSDGAILTLEGENQKFVVDTTRGEIIMASLEGQEAMDAFRGSLHYAKARQGIRIFLQDPGFDYPFAAFRFENSTYQLSAPGVLFRVNATTGSISKAELQGSDAIAMIKGSADYQKAVQEVSIQTGINST